MPPKTPICFVNNRLYRSNFTGVKVLLLRDPFIIPRLLKIVMLVWRLLAEPLALSFVVLLFYGRIIRP